MFLYSRLTIPQMTEAVNDFKISPVIFPDNFQAINYQFINNVDSSMSITGSTVIMDDTSYAIQSLGFTYYTSQECIVKFGGYNNSLGQNSLLFSYSYSSHRYLETLILALHPNYSYSSGGIQFRIHNVTSYTSSYGLAPNLKTIIFENFSRIEFYISASASNVTSVSMYFPALTTIDFGKATILATTNSYNFTATAPNLVNIKASNLTQIGRYGFASFKGSYLSLPKVTQLIEYTETGYTGMWGFNFQWCTNLKELSLPALNSTYESTGTILGNISNTSPNLETIFLGPNFKGKLYTSAITNLPALKYVNLGAISNIGQQFSGCSNLTISFAATLSSVPSIYSGAYFAAIKSVYVPASLLTSFKNASYWKTISTKIFSF